MADTDKLAAEMLDPNYAGELQHLRPWSEIDRIFREAAATVTALEAENKRLREALEPFAREASEDDGSPRADWLYVHDNELVASFFIDLTFGHFRRARDISRNRRES